jgi:hypothetical protein
LVWRWNIPAVCLLLVGMALEHSSSVPVVSWYGAGTFQQCVASNGWCLVTGELKGIWNEAGLA